MASGTGATGEAKERIEVLEAKCALLAAALNKADADRDAAFALLREWVDADNERDTDTRSISRRSVRLIS